MAPSFQKRKRQDDAGSDSDVSSASNFDISDVLTGKRPRVEQNDDYDSDDHEALEDLIQVTKAKRAMKEGTQIIKKAKGKAKIEKGEVGGGSFQSLGLHPSILRSLTLQGYRIPTPIQRLSLPILLGNPPRDLVGMARTGSGKTLAYMIPLIQRLGGRHSVAFGARALILIPTRELALQVLKVGKELARGFQHGHGDHAGDKSSTDSGKGQNLRWGLVVGGEGLDDQFEMITNNPDVIIATPGRLLHLIVEMNLDLKSIQSVVFDEADRLFEMGFEVALNEILARLPASRQTILFSATLPKSLVEFAKAGLQDPKLVRLDAESKISPDLRMAFFSIKQAEKDACLLALLRDVIKVPLGANTLPPKDASSSRGKSKHVEHVTAPHQTLIFAATKHHVEYLLTLLTAAGYAVSHLYGSLDQSARFHQMNLFRTGVTSVLVVTDVAARGIDIPVLENVINYDFPQGARVFVHRVGRTARAGRKGWAWSFVTYSELPYLLDLQLFLGRPLVNDIEEDTEDVYSNSLVLGTFRRERIDEDVEYIRSLETSHHSLPTLRDVMKRGQSMYERSKGKASPASYKRAKEMQKDPKWLLAASDSGVHPVLLRGGDESLKKDRVQEAEKKKLLRMVNAFRPNETIFELGSKNNSETAALMRERRKALKKSAERALHKPEDNDDEDEEEDEDDEDVNVERVAFGPSSKSNFRDEEFYLSYTQKDAETDKGYSLTDGASSFTRQAQNVAFDLTNDEGKVGKAKHVTTWDKKKKKFVKGDGVGADNKKLVRTENGTRLPATFRSGRFDEWKSKTRINLPRVGEVEHAPRGGSRPGPSSRFKHTRQDAAKPLDKFAKDYERKLRQQKKKTKESGGADEAGPSAGPKGKKGLARFRGKPVGRVKNELKTVGQIHKTRKIMEQRRAKNARKPKNPGRKGR